MYKKKLLACLMLLSISSCGSKGSSNMKPNHNSKANNSSNVADFIKYKIWEVDSEKDKKPTYYYFNSNSFRTCVIDKNSKLVFLKQKFSYSFTQETQIEINDLGKTKLISITTAPYVYFEFLPENKKLLLNEIVDNHAKDTIMNKCDFSFQ